MTKNLGNGLSYLRWAPLEPFKTNRLRVYYLREVKKRSLLKKKTFFRKRGEVEGY